MTLVSYRPFSGFDSARDGMSRVFNDVLSGMERPEADSFAPPVDIIEREDSLLILADLPGVDQESIDVSIDGRTLSLAGDRRVATGTTEGRTFRTERRHGRLERSFTLPANVESGRITAEYTDGVLRVTVPKSPESRPRKIEVTTA